MWDLPHWSDKKLATWRPVRKVVAEGGLPEVACWECESGGRGTERPQNSALAGGAQESARGMESGDWRLGRELRCRRAPPRGGQSCRCACAAAAVARPGESRLPSSTRPSEPQCLYQRNGKRSQLTRVNHLCRFGHCARHFACHVVGSSPKL